MAAWLDNVRFNPTAGALTDWTFSSAVAGYQSPASAGVVNGTKYKYFAIDASNNWELGEGAYNTGTGVLARTTIIFSSTGSKINFAAAPQVAIVALKEDMISIEEANSFTTTQKAQAQQNIAVPPTTQSLTSGTAATYTTGIQGGQRATWIEVFMAGGGGGGGGATSGVANTVAGSDGAASSFNSIVANPGKGALASIGTSQPAPGGAGGTGGTGTATRRMPGQPGTCGGNSVTNDLNYSTGGSSVLFGGGAACPATGNSAGIAGGTNTGGGGSGATNNTVTNNNVAAGGGGGESVYLLINNPAATYTYTVGAGGAGGSSTNSGGAGGSGFIFVIEHYGS